MPLDVARQALYSARINLWVEDDLTRAYLAALWNNPTVKFLFGGGRQGVEAILNDAEDAGYRNVFGVVDRDHGRTNFASWFDPNRSFRKFILPRHEIENCLLDTHALEGCRSNTRKLHALDIDATLREEAIRRCYWMACRDVVALIRNHFFDQFIKYPKIPPVDCEAAATDHIVGCDWFRKLSRKAAGMTGARIKRLVQSRYLRARALVNSEQWRVDFAGKEFFHLIAGQIAMPSRANPTEFRIDLAKQIAAWQVVNDAVPGDLEKLLAALTTRVAFP